MNWTDGITCSVLRDGDAVAEVQCLHTGPAHEGCLYNIQCVGLWLFGGLADDMDSAKAAAERAIRTMRGEGEG